MSSPSAVVFATVNPVVVCLIQIIQRWSRECGVIFVQARNVRHSSLSPHSLDEKSHQMPSPSRTLRAAIEQLKPIKWSETLQLPKSAFPARASVEELRKYRTRCADDLYAWQRVHRPKDNEFVLHDGPPYANGAVHVGHALNKVLKDIILRWELSRGRRVHYRPGWDCHGLPIELKALQQAHEHDTEITALSDVAKEGAAVVAAASAFKMSAGEVRKRARDLAATTIEAQKASFRSWGVMGEWEQPYQTMEVGFELRQLGVFREMVRKGE